MNEHIIDEYDKLINFVDLSFLKNKTIMITGASGLIGSYIVESLIRSNDVMKSNITVLAVVRSLESAKKRFEEILNKDNFKIIEQDVSVAIDSPIISDYIIHAASNANPKAFDEDPIGTIKANVNGTINLLDYAKRVGSTKLLYLSSTEIYGENITGVDYFKETDMGVIDPMTPRSCYTESKRMAENICVNYSKQYGVSTNIVRIGYGYGPTYTKKDNRVIPQFVRNVISDEDIIMKSSGSLVRSYVYIFDVVTAILKVLEVGEESSVYNISNSDSDVSIRDIADSVAKHSNKSVIFEISEDDANKGYAPFSMGLINSDKLKDLGWIPIFDLDSGISSVIDYQKSINK